MKHFKNSSYINRSLLSRISLIWLNKNRLSFLWFRRLNTTCLCFIGLKVCSLNLCGFTDQINYYLLHIVKNFKNVKLFNKIIILCFTGLAANAFTPEPSHWTWCLVSEMELILILYLFPLNGAQSTLCAEQVLISEHNIALYSLLQRKIFINIIQISYSLSIYSVFSRQGFSV